MTPTGWVIQGTQRQQQLQLEDTEQRSRLRPCTGASPGNCSPIQRLLHTWGALSMTQCPCLPFLLRERDLKGTNEKVPSRRCLPATPGHQDLPMALRMHAKAPVS